MMPLKDLFGVAGYVIEAVGVISIVLGFALSAFWFLTRLRRLVLEFEIEGHWPWQRHRVKS